LLDVKLVVQIKNNVKLCVFSTVGNPYLSKWAVCFLAIKR
jgi:hypothetical protein